MKIKEMGEDQLEEHLSNFLVRRVSVSSMNALIQNPIRFEKEYIFRIRDTAKSGALVAGNAYHHATEMYFRSIAEGNYMDVIDFDSLWKQYLESYNPLLLDCGVKSYEDKMIELNKACQKMSDNFFKEKDGVYIFDEILDVEEFNTSFLTINRSLDGGGEEFEIPLPFITKTDLVTKKDGKITIWDHKSKLNGFSKEENRKVSYGMNAYAYAIEFENRTGEKVEKVDRVVFVENKVPQNRDKSPQLLAIEFELNDSFRAIFSEMFYQNVKYFCSIVSDPFFEFPINPMDNFTTQEDSLEFWLKSKMPSELEEFVSDNSAIAKRVKHKISKGGNLVNFEMGEYRSKKKSIIIPNFSKMSQSEKIEYVLNRHDSDVQVAEIVEGASVDSILVSMAISTKLKKIIGLESEIAHALQVPNVRVSRQLCKYGEKYFVKIEVPKKERKFFELPENIDCDSKIPLGVDTLGNYLYWDSESPTSPHQLVCGKTGSGKSEFIKSEAYSIRKKFRHAKIIVLDSKFTLRKELGVIPSEVYEEIDDIEARMELLVEEMNNLVKRGEKQDVFIIFDEFSDAFDSSKKGNQLKIYKDLIVGNYATGAPKYKKTHVDTKKSLEENLKMILQKGRSSGFRVMAATQRASVKVISGDAKANFGMLVCFMMNKEVDSNVILDEGGAEKLLGKGDGLLKSPDYNDVVRFQSFYKK